MPKPIGRDQRYMPGLDGLRAVAVLAVVAYHVGFSWAPGGLLGVGVFFTLSGYLITDLLLGEWHSTNGLQLADFWLRRARRLLPALLVMLAVVAIWVSVADRAQLGPLRGAELAGTFYVSNWWLILHHVSYFSRFGPPSPIGNLWSLGIEEQFYLIWPWLLWLGLLWTRGRRAQQPSRAQIQRTARRRRILVVITVVAALLSAMEMALLFHPSLDPSRVYDGTDTRAFSVLIGAALAMVWPSRSLRSDVTKGARLLIDGLGVLGLVGIGALVWGTTQYSPFLYRGGMFLLSLATAAVVMSATHPASRVGRALGWLPLRWIGVRSYGIYLWQYPIIVLTSPSLTAIGPTSSGVDWPRALSQLAAIVVIAALSWHFIETPIRHGALGRLWRSIKARKWHPALAGAEAWAALTAAALTFVVGGVGLAGALPGSAGSQGTASGTNLHFGHTAPPGKVIHPTTTTLPPTTTAPASPTTSASAPSSTTASGSPTSAPATTAASPVSSCRSVVHIGDSTSESLISNDYLNPSEQLPAQYARVGVGNVVLEIQGATSVDETINGEPNAQQVAQGLINQGYHGCWVIALGTNDAADVAVGSSMNLAQRVQAMMSVIGNQPVMWVTAESLLDSGPYANANMQQWNQAIIQACPQHPNMRVYDWASVAQPGWYISDGIHYSSDGSAVRSSDIATALAEAFPETSPPKGSRGSTAGTGCIVH